MSAVVRIEAWPSRLWITSSGTPTSLIMCPAEWRRRWKVSWWPPRGVRYAVGERVVALAPAAGKVLTSETGTVVGIRPAETALLVRLDDDGEIRRLEGDEISDARLAHGYAVTVHRSQGDTVEADHSLNDGGGRELAYVRMSRARGRSTLYQVAESMAQAKEDLLRDWSEDHRLTWAIDGGVAAGPAGVDSPVALPAAIADSLRRARLIAERNAILAVIPPNPTEEIRAAEVQRDRLERRRADLAEGIGEFCDHPVGAALRDLNTAESNVARLERNVSSNWPRKERSAWRDDLREWRPKVAAAAHRVADVTGPEQAGLDGEERELVERLSGLGAQRDAHQSWRASHPEAAIRLDRSLRRSIASTRPDTASP